MYKVLIVDDEKMIRMGMKKVTSMAGTENRRSLYCGVWKRSAWNFRRISSSDYD